MPQISDITVKKADGTTNVTYSAVSPSSGDKTAAVWKNTAQGSAPAFQPELRLVGRETTFEGKPARSVRATFSFPVVATNTQDGYTYVWRRISGSHEVVVPKDVLTTDAQEAVAQLANLIASTIIKSCGSSGYSAS